ANFDDDPSDPDDIILVTIRNPKVGKYVLKVIGNTTGDYYVDSTYVNDNGVFDDSNEGTINVSESKIIEEVVSETAGFNPSQKLSEVVADLQKILVTLIEEKDKNQQGLNKEQYKKLMEPLEKLQHLARDYEAIPNTEKKHETTNLLKKIEEQRHKFASEIDKLVLKEKINQETASVLLVLRQRLLDAVLR
ncbi:MAG: hypothetical protein Q7S57_00895, partial [bacterium]|nr:hypothetical protein [bacterium]